MFFHLRYASCEIRIAFFTLSLPSPSFFSLLLYLLPFFSPLTIFRIRETIRRPMIPQGTQTTTSFSLPFELFITLLSFDPPFFFVIYSHCIYFIFTFSFLFLHKYVILPSTCCFPYLLSFIVSEYIYVIIGFFLLLLACVRP